MGPCGYPCKHDVSNIYDHCSKEPLMLVQAQAYIKHHNIPALSIVPDEEPSILLDTPDTPNSLSAVRTRRNSLQEPSV